MNISKKWGAVLATALVAALVAGGAGTANAAPGDPLNPQPADSAQPGSKGGFFLWDGNTATYADGDPNRVYARDEILFASGSATDINAEINVSATRPVTGDQPFNQVWRFLSKKTTADLFGGTNTWNAYAVDGAAGPNGGTMSADFTLESIAAGPGGIADDIAAGGSYWYGIGYTINSGVTLVAAVYREITIEPGTGNYTVSPVIVEQPPTEVAPAITEQPAAQTVEAGTAATFTAAASGAPAPTVAWESNTGSGWTPVAGATDITLTVANTALVQNGTQFRAVFTNAAGSATTNAAILTVRPTEPVAGDPGNVTVQNPAAGATTIQVPVAAQYNGQSLTTWAWSTPTQLPNSPVANGAATVDISTLEPGEHTIALTDPATSTVVAWTTITVALAPNTSETDLTVDVVTSNKFALEGVSAAVDLGEVSRGRTTVATPLSPFTVTDDRTTLPGWNLTASVSQFTNAAANDVIPNSALGLKPKQVGTGVTGVTLGAERVAGSADYTAALFAEGAANSTTGEGGTQFDADLTFAAPQSAKTGMYSSTLTLTLTSK